MNLKNLAEFIAVVDKLEIDNNSNLTEIEKEIYKNAIDEIKKQVK